MYARTARTRTTGMPMAVCDSTYELEFRSTVDDAWYSVRVVLDDDTLVVKFLNFSEAHDERFRSGDFETAKAVDEFVERFRPVSQQLQDSQCSRVIEGMTVCASFAFGQDDVRFYDAVVEDVQYVEHSFAKGEEECLCNFILFWHHGPNEGNKMPATVANICLLRPFAQVDSRVASFSKMAKEKFVTPSLMSASVSDVKTSLCKGGMPDYENINLSTNPKCSLFQSEIQVKKSFRFSGSSVRTEEGRISKCHELDFQHVDLGGGSSTGETGSQHFILLENLEKDLSPLSIMEFIYKQTSISPQAYVFPSLSSESYTRGAIVLDCEEQREKIYKFINNPDHFIISARGRPWIIAERFSRYGPFRTALGSLMTTSKNTNIGDLRAVQKGCEGYRTAELRRDLYMDFACNRQRLHDRLALEEKKILDQSPTV